MTKLDAIMHRGLLFSHLLIDDNLRAALSRQFLKTLNKGRFCGHTKCLSAPFYIRLINRTG